MSSAQAERSSIVRYTGAGPAGAVDDWLSVEEPLEIRLSGETLAVTMRTPGHDYELAAGFLLSEGLIQSQAELGTLRHCGDSSKEGYGNVLDVLPAPGRAFDVPELADRRRTLTSSACGVCGRLTIDDLLERAARLDDASPLPVSVITETARTLLEKQAHFAVTGGLHAAAITDTTGRFDLIREDVGRHNAVDKALGRLLFDDRLRRQGRILVVSGRASFEIVQKAVTAGIGCVICVSAPSSLAVTTAKRANLLLIGFARGERFNVYHGAERIVAG